MLRNSRILGFGILDFYYRNSSLSSRILDFNSRNSSFSLGYGVFLFLGILEFPTMSSPSLFGESLYFRILCDEIPQSSWGMTE